MSNIDHELMKSLEYDGPYGARYNCGQCVHFSEGKCGMLPKQLTVSGANNVCLKFEVRIKNPSAPEFNLDDYLEFLYSDYYRPWSVDDSIIIGSAKLGACIMDGGKLARMLPNTYSPLYQSYDKPYCRVQSGPRCKVQVGDHNFEIDYRKYRDLAFINDANEITYDVHYWKDKPTQRKYKSEYNGKYPIKSEVPE